MPMMMRAHVAWSLILAMSLAAGCADRPIDPEPLCPADRDDLIAFAAVAHVEDSEGIVLLIGRDRNGDRYVSDEIPNEVVVAPLSNP